MKRTLYLLSVLMLTLLLLGGCASNQEDFVIVGNQGTQPTRQIRVQSILAQNRTVPTTVTAIVATGLGSAHTLVYGPDSRTPGSTLLFEVPLNVTEFRLAYVNANGDVVGVFQTDVPSGTSEFVINNPGFVDLNAFVEALAANPTSATLNIGDNKTIQVTATLSNGNTADVSAFVTTTSQNTAVVSTNGSQLTGSSAGTASVTVQLFNVSTSVPVTVNDFRQGLLSSVDGTTPGDDSSLVASISNDGRMVAFESAASNLVAGGTTIKDVYVLDRNDGSIRIVSNRSNGNASQAKSVGPQISGNGRYVVFLSDDSLVPEDTNGVADVYLYDLKTSTLELISVNSAGTAAGNGDSKLYSGTITDDGRFISFYSTATNLTTFNDTNGFQDVFLRDRQTGTTEIISVSTNNTQSNGDSFIYDDGISADGRYVTFYTNATNLESGVTDNNHMLDAMLRDRTNGTTTYLSKAVGTNNTGSGISYVSWMSSDGSKIIVVSRAGDIVSPALTLSNSQLFLYSTATGNFELLTQDDQSNPLGGANSGGQLSSDERYLLFLNRGDSTLDPGDQGQLVMKDRNSGEYRIVSSAAGGAPGADGNSLYGSAMTPDGRYVVFESDSDNLAIQQVVSTVSQVFGALNPFL